MDSSPGDFSPAFLQESLPQPLFLFVMSDPVALKLGTLV